MTRVTRRLLTIALSLSAIASMHTTATAQSRRATDPRYLDAHVDRVVLAPTAETHPEGTFFGSLYEIVLPQVGYAPTQRLQLSLTGFSDFAANPSFIMELTAKANLLRTRTLRIAALNAIDIIRADDEALIFGRIGATAQLCFSVECLSSVSVSGMVVIHDKADVLFPFGFSIGFIGHIEGQAKALLEYGTLNSFSEAFPIDGLPFWYVAYGVRFSEEAWGVDIAFIREMDLRTLQGDQRASFGDIMGVPFLAFTYRMGRD